MPTVFFACPHRDGRPQRLCKRESSSAAWDTGLFCAVVPDADVISSTFGIQYGVGFRHRGLTHSFYFALLLALILCALFYKDERPGSPPWRKKVLFFFAVGSRHGVLDAFTAGRMGDSSLSPFSNHRFLFSWRPIRISPIGIGAFFNRSGLQVVYSEIVSIWLALFAASRLSAGEDDANRES